MTSPPLDAAGAYQRIAYALLRQGHAAALAALQDAVAREAADIITRWRDSQRISRQAREDAEALAQQRYAAEVLAIMDARQAAGRELTAADVELTHRTPLAWGIAAILRGG